MHKMRINPSIRPTRHEFSCVRLEIQVWVLKKTHAERQRARCQAAGQFSISNLILANVPHLNSSLIL